MTNLQELFSGLTAEQAEKLAAIAEILKRGNEKIEAKTYNTIWPQLLKPGYIIGDNLNSIMKAFDSNGGNLASELSARYMIAVTKLRNMADYFNGCEIVDNKDRGAYQLRFHARESGVGVESGFIANFGLPMFKTRESALSALKMLTSEELKSLFGTDKIEGWDAD